MTDKPSKKPLSSKWITIVVTVLATLAVSGSAAYLLGYIGPRTALDPHDHDGASETLMGDAVETQLWTCGMHPWILTEEPGLCPICNMELTPKRDTESAGDAPSGERQVAYWRAPMDPMEIYEEPGKSKMGMDLVPVYEDEIIGGVEVKIDPVTQQNMGIRTTEVSMAPLVHTIRTYGHITYDETRIAQVSPKFSGWIEKLYVDFTGRFVETGAPLFETYSPDLLAAQEEYLGTYRTLAGRGRNNELLVSARRRLLYYDVAEEEIRNMEETGEVKKTLVIRSPHTGVVIHKNAVEGAYVKAGTTIYTIADLSRVWVEAHIYEYELPWVEVGQEAEMRLSFHPGTVFTGRVAYIYPYLQQKTRDVVIRLEFDNPDMTLKPDMFADVMIRTVGKGKGLVIPSEAVIRSGQRNVVFVDRGEGKFTPREVELGLSLDGNRVQVLSGLGPGETVVTSGQFLLDSESKLKEAVQKMMEAKTGGPERPAETAGEDFFDDLEAGGDDFFDDLETPSEPNAEADFFNDLE